MLRADDLARLSAFAAGDMEAAESAAFARELEQRPDLQLALQQLHALDGMIADRAADLRRPLVDAAMRKVLRPRRWPYAVAACALLALALLWPRNETQLPVPLATGVVEDNRTMYLSGHPATVDVGDVHIVVDGVAVVSAEPLHAAERVISTQGDVPMLKERFARLAGSTLALVVIQGSVTVTAAGETHLVTDTWTIGAMPTPKAIPPPQKKDAPTQPPEMRRCSLLNNLPPEPFEKAMQRAQPSFDACAASACSSDNCVGLFGVKLHIGAGGKLLNIDIEPEHSLSNPVLMSCVTQALSRVDFPAPLQGDEAKPTLHFSGLKGSDGRYKIESPTSFKCPAVFEPEDTTAREQVDSSGPARGPANAPITIVEFSDFECPFCVRAEDTVRQIEQAYPGKVRWVFKHKPLPPDFHSHAKPAAEAAIAAGQQGKFWEYAALLFSNTHALDRASFSRYAKELKLDVAAFDKALDSGTLTFEVDRDLAEAERLKVKGIPTFFVNGRRVMGAQPFDNFKKLIDEELAK